MGKFKWNLVRYRMVFGTFILSMIVLFDRILISVAKDPVAADLALSDKQMGWVLSIFALGYALFQTPSGYLADKYGVRKVLTAVVTLWSVFTALTGAVYNFFALFVVRFIFGVSKLKLAVEYYRKSIIKNRVNSNPSVRLTLNYAELIVKLNQTEQYDNLVKLLKSHLIEDLKPTHKFKISSILTLIFAAKKDMRQLRYYKRMAKENARFEATMLHSDEHLSIVKKTHNMNSPMAN